MTMKKFLLFAVATALAVSVNAQQFNKRAAGKSQSNGRQFLSQKLETKGIVGYDKAPGQLVLAGTYGHEKVSRSSLRSMKAVNVEAVTLTAKRAAEVQAEYSGYGADYLNEGKAVSWTMKSGKSTTDELLLIDVIPNPFSESIEYIPVAYTIDGSTVTIAPQKVASGGGYFVYVFSWASSDGSIVMQLGDDGSLTTVANEDITYGAFTEDAYPGENLKSVRNGGTYAGSYQDIEKVKYYLAGQITAPTAMYEPEGLYLHAHYSPTFYGYSYNYSIIPANAPVSFKSTVSDPATTWSWSIINADDESEITSSEVDFTFNSTAGNAYTPAKLIVSNDAGASAPFQWGMMGLDEEGKPNYENAYLFAGESGSSFKMSDGTYSIITKCNPDFSIAYYSFLATPDLNSNNYSLSSLILYQGKPSAPLYIEGVNYLVRDFVAKDNFNLKCKLQKVTRSADGKLTMGEVIAESDINIDDVYQEESIAQLNWTSFYTEDENGMSKALDYMFIEDEFAVVIEGWDNGSFSCAPYGEYDYNENGVTSTFIMQTGDDGVYRFSSLYPHQMVGFNGATYGYLATEDNTDMTIPAEGGEAKIHVQPMLYSVDDENNVKTRLFLDENIEDNEIPEWLEVTSTDPVLTGTGEDAVYDLAFDLTFKAEALPEGVTGRQAELVFMQEGAQLKVTVTQGEATGIAVAKTQVKANNAQMYNLAGQRVGKDYKGLVIKNNRKMLNK